MPVFAIFRRVMKLKKCAEKLVSIFMTSKVTRMLPILSI